jgi:predicted DNA-binding transcriptional regulator AlpA
MKKNLAVHAPEKTQFVLPPGEEPIFIERQLVEQLVCLKRTAIHRLTRRGEFPRGIKISGTVGKTGGKVVWIKQEIQFWVRQQIDDKRSELGQYVDNMARLGEHV